jgi:hypothetical protein
MGKGQTKNQPEGKSDRRRRESAGSDRKAEDKNYFRNHYERIVRYSSWFVEGLSQCEAGESAAANQTVPERSRKCVFPARATINV